jgi:hypothetical protein
MLGLVCRATGAANAGAEKAVTLKTAMIAIRIIVLPCDFS